MRQYEPLWIRLKKDGVLKLDCAPESHAGIKRMLSKEKDMDTPWKLVQQERNTGPILSFESEDRILTVTLKFTKIGALFI